MTSQETTQVPMIFLSNIIILILNNDIVHHIAHFNGYFGMHFFLYSKAG